MKRCDMKTTRRGFVRTLGYGAVGTSLLGAAVALPGSLSPLSRALAQTRQEHRRGVFDGGIIQLNQNESARGPGPRTLEAIRTYTSKRVGRGYAPDHYNELRDAIAGHYRLQREQVILSTGSTPQLRAVVHAFCDAERGLVTASPTFSTSEARARDLGVPVYSVPLDDGLYLDLDGMAEAVAETRPGLLYVCNPNNPSGTVHGPDAIDALVRRVMAESPDTRIFMDEAYIDYVDPARMSTALPLALEFPNVIVSRTFSKAHGMAGLRVGYAMGHPDTLQAMRAAWGHGDVNMLGAVAALTAFEDREHIAWERQENAAIRAEATALFRELGYTVADSHTNHIFPDLGRPAKAFRDACLEHKVLVGRDFPPLHHSHCRISLGSREEMQTALKVFRQVLTT